MDFNTFYFSVWNIEYILQILIAEALCCVSFKRRKHFALRATLSVAACILLYALLRAGDMLLNLWGAPPYLFELKLLVAFLITIGGMAVCFDVPIWNILFVACAAQSAQHIVFEIDMLVTRQLIQDISVLLYIVISLGIYILGYAALYFLFFSKMKRKEFSNISNRRMIFAIIICVVICFAVSWYGQGMYRGAGSALFRGTLAVMCFILLAYQFSFLDNSTVHMENVRLQQILLDSQKRYDISEENREIINVKCHDIKKQLSEYGQRLRIDEDSMQEMLSAVNIYDSSFHTGNDALDIVLSDKALHCEQNNIAFGAIVDGAACGFLPPIDIYALFGNVLDNAMEAVKKLNDPSKAIINLHVRSEGKAVIVHCENYFEGSLQFADGLPLSTKGDDVYHGYGMKSIRMVAEKYGGTMTVSVDGDIFILNVMLLPNAKKDEGNVSA